MKFNSKDKSESKYDRIESICNFAAYFIIVLSIGIYGGRLIFILVRSSPKLTKVHCRILLLCISIIVTFCCFFIRLMWTFFYTIKHNVLQDRLNDLIEEIKEKDDKWYKNY